MKKTFLTAGLALLLGMTAQAQEGIYQFADPGFEQYTGSDAEPGNGWNSFNSATGSMAGLGKGSSPKPSSVSPGANGTSHGVQIYSKSIFGQKANGNLTTGMINMGSTTPSSSSNYNYTKRDDATHSLRFAGRPDAVTFYAKFTSGGSENGRGQFILHGDCDYRDPEVSDQSSYRIGIASALIPASSDWQKYEATFSYDKPQSGVQYLLASFTTNPVPGGSANDYLQIDEVYFVYYSTLTSLSYEGASLNFSEGTHSYNLSGVAYEPSKLSYTKKGAGAVVEHSYDATSGLLTLTVKGNDYAVNAANQTVYTVQFDNSTEPVIPEIEVGKAYRIKHTDTGYYLNASNYDAHEGGPVGGVNVVAKAESDDQIFVFEASGSNYMLKSKSGRYVYCQQWNVDALDNGTALNFVNNGDGTYYIMNGSNYFKVESVDGTYYPFCDAPSSSAAKFALEAVDGDVVTPDPDPEPEPEPEPTDAYTINFDKNATASHIHNRYLNSISLTAQGASAQTISCNSEKAYNDLSANESNYFTCNVGDQLTAEFGFDGYWMNAYIYVDEGQDGKFSYKEGATDQNGTDLKSFSFYSGDFNNDASGYNSAGEYISGDARSNWTCPAFTAPSKPGLYRIRYKIDWNSVDPGGQMAADGTCTGTNGILANGGYIVDATLSVVDPTAIDNVTVNAERNNDIFDLSGRKLRAVSGKGVYIIGGKKVMVGK
ncbi:MAG: hypothetical protein J6C15_08265 [Bacteroidaceae bacterium]|nr:hypothetical protein [Bacteroidaceae bacterium]